MRAFINEGNDWPTDFWPTRRVPDGFCPPKPPCPGEVIQNKTSPYAARAAGTKSYAESMPIYGQIVKCFGEESALGYLATRDPAVANILATNLIDGQRNRFLVVRFEAPACRMAKALAIHSRLYRPNDRLVAACPFASGAAFRTHVL